MQILVCDDESLIRDVIKEYLLIEKFQVFEASNGLEAIEVVANKDIDLVIMDIMMPKMDGYQAIKEIKKIKDIPFIMLTARSEEFDKLLGFDIGADDYVTKPFSPKELVARVKAVTKRFQNEEISFVYEDLVLDDLAHEVKVDGEIIDLTPKEYELLKYFMQNKNIALSRDTILSNIWGYDFYGDERTVDTHVKTLRNNLGKYRDNIKTVRGMGYKFEVKEKN
ncbi:MAG: response regulator transcription factor [Bacilli bacterium]|jgi:two-component system response regulator ResD|nr:response regulator transcription factor [Bacilli bacterium]